MDTKKAIALLSKYQDGTITSEERALLESWYISQAKESKHQLSEQAIEESFNYLKAQLPVKGTKVVRLWPRIAIASAVALIMIGVYFFRASFTSTDHENTALVTADIAPGKNGATLTLANGTRILIDDALTGDIASQSGVRIIKGKNGQIIYEITGQSSGELEYNVLATTRGEQTQVRLPDGSLVFLNAASSLKYPSNFAKASQRRVSLKGEGYFEVYKDRDHPFVVEAGSQEVEVLGTHFNINAYVDEPVVATTLTEGSVKVRTAGSSVIIKPGEQAVNNGVAINVAKVNLETVTDWKEGDFVLNDMNFKTAMREIARWYDVEVIYDQSVTDGLQSGGWISRNTNLSEVLTLIEKSGLVQFRLEGRKLYVSRKASSK